MEIGAIEDVNFEILIDALPSCWPKYDNPIARKATPSGHRLLQHHNLESIYRRVVKINSVTLARKITQVLVCLGIIQKLTNRYFRLLLCD